MPTDSPADPFFQPYDRDDIAYGERPSAPLAAYLEQAGGGGNALDLGAGAGRDSLALASAGFDVLAVDMSQRGLERISERATARGIGGKIKTRCADVREFEFAVNHYDAIVATTVLDHIPAEDAKSVWENLVNGINDKGMLYIEVHTTEDPGCDVEPGCSSSSPVSETASAVVNYFAPNQLAIWAAAADSRLRILQYNERLEWDYTHGAEHQHGKAILLAVRAGYHPDWYGQPAAFPRSRK